MIALKRSLAVVIVGLTVVLVALVVIGGSSSAYRLPWIPAMTLLESLQSRLDSSLRTPGAEATVATTFDPADPPTLTFVIGVPDLDSYDKLDPYRAMNVGLEQLPEVTNISLVVQERLPDGTFDQFSYLWQPWDNRVGLYRGTYDPTFRGDQGGIGVGYVDGMTPVALAKVASGESAPRMSGPR